MSARRRWIRGESLSCEHERVLAGVTVTDDPVRRSRALALD
jgi:hypothetical protein